MDFVKDECLKAHSYRSPVRIIMCKLKHLRVALRNWNYAVFGNLNRRIELWSHLNSGNKFSKELFSL